MGRKTWTYEEKLDAQLLTCNTAKRTAHTNIYPLKFQQKTGQRLLEKKKKRMLCVKVWEMM